jgi:hypothetical protein
MDEEDPIPIETLRRFVFPKGKADLFAMLAEMPGLDTYLVPMVSLNQAVRMLISLGKMRSEAPDGPVLELTSVVRGGIEAQITHSERWSPDGWVPILLSTARSNLSFLSEKGYQL